MTSLDIARQGYSAARQIEIQRRADVLMPAELERLMKHVLAGFEQMMPGGEAPPSAPPPIPPAIVRGGALKVHEGGRL